MSRIRYTALLSITVSLALSTDAHYLSESWAMVASDDRQTGPRCVSIPANLTICKGIQYTQMRLPNLLEHETIAEVVQQSGDWQSLLNLNCHSDAQLFLCSVFAPICLPDMDRAIMPCKSLCDTVQQGCEGRMSQYGFPWPDMLRCDQYPADDDMCIRPLAASAKPNNAPCESCTQVGTYENIIDNFCRAQLVMKARIEDVHGSEIRIRGARSLKKGDKKRSVEEKVVSLSARGACPCELPKGAPLNQKYLIMANRDADDRLVASLILPWKKEKNFKRAVHQFTRLNCKSLGREISE